MSQSLQEKSAAPGIFPQLNAAEVMEDVRGYCQETLERSRFFSLLAKNELDDDTLKYVFSQFYLWRNIFHTWFGFAISASGSCASPEAKEAILSLAEHIVIETKEHHDVQFLNFLQQLGVSPDDVRLLKPSPATRRYSASFFEVHQDREDGFFHMVAAIAGREMLASMRNAHVIRTYFERYGKQVKPWWDLHETVEFDHFHAEIAPVLRVWERTGKSIADLHNTMWAEIDRHAEYWDSLLSESPQGTATN